jgi:transcription termination factor Rho
MPEPHAPTGVTFPHRHVPIARPGAPRQAQVLELAAPLALGQRGLVVGAPRTGATTVLRWLGAALADAGVQVHAILVDRPVEEQLEWREELPGVRLVGTTSDVEGPEDHLRLASAFDEARAATLAGTDAAVLVDSLGALARALAATHDHTDGRVLDGGLPQTALTELRGWFSMARAVDETGGDAGSLTILGTALVGTEQQLDEVVLHELVGTGNVEWRLDEDAMRAGLFPPVDVLGSGARRTELIVGEREADRRALLRSEVDRHGTVAGLGLLADRIDDAGSLDAVLDQVAGSR